MARITLNGVSFDPLAEPPQLDAVSPHSADASASDYLLVQTRGPLSDAEKAELAALGAVIHEYVPDDTYLCGYRPTDLAAIRALPFVAWADVYLHGFKIAPSLRPGRPPTASALAEVSPALSRTLRQVDVVLHDDVDTAPAELRQQIAAGAHVDADGLETGRNKVRLTVQENRLADLAALDQVHHIEEVPERQLFNNVARGILHAQVLVKGSPYQGQGQVIAVADTGFDKGSKTGVHPAFTGRVAKLYALGRPAPAKADDPHGHGTHVAGSALGNGSSAKMGGAIQGTAPKARLVLQSMLGSAGDLAGIPTDLHDLFEPPYVNDKARVHTNSWGSRIGGLPYDASAREIDDVVWKRQDLVICFAAGNEGVDGNADGVIDGRSIGSQSAAKNCITVGASESVRSHFGGTYGDLDFPAEPIRSDRQANNSAGMAAFSSRGPTHEARIKPDVVAPGTSILSTRSRALVTPTTRFGTSADPAFFFDSGTSMATPLVAGCAAVLRETLQKNGRPNPSAALIKALLVNGAVDLPGQYVPSEAGASPNPSSGFGLVDLAGSVIIPGPNANAGLGEGGPLKQGASDTITIHVPQGSSNHGVDAPTGVGRTLKITLVWTDPPGAGLQNDLDLIVRAGGKERHGNMGTSADFDRRNNVEQVVWHGIPAGDAQVVVRAFRITKFAQPYAYAWRLSG